MNHGNASKAKASPRISKKKQFNRSERPAASGRDAPAISELPSTPQAHPTSRVLSNGEMQIKFASLSSV